MRGRYMVLGCVLLATGLVGTARAQVRTLTGSSFSVDDAGMVRTLEVATDEIAVRRSGGTCTVEKVGPFADAESIRRSALARKQLADEEVDLVLYEPGVPRTIYTRRILTRGVLVRLDAGANLADVEEESGAVGRWAPGGGGWLIFDAADAGGALILADTLRGVKGVASADPLLARQHEKRYTPNDTLFSDQWHLVNTGQIGGTPGIDVNVTNVWDTYRGSGVYIGICDDGLQTSHEDLSANVNTIIDWDWNGGDGSPDPNTAQDFHGSACAGVAAGRGNNALGICGGAPQATLVGMRLIAGYVDDATEAQAMLHSNTIIWIKSNSWGPVDNGYTLAGPGSVTRAALSNGVHNGRGGKGTIYLWAGGNGLQYNDNVNYDGYANSVYTIAIAALDNTGGQSYYSEPGACLLVTAPSSGSNGGITTTDLMGSSGYNSGAGWDLADPNYTAYFGGTSSATPLVAGIMALILQANTNLGWRDAQEILIRCARQVSPSDSDWSTNSAGFHFNHKFGAGLIDARAAVTLAETWTNLGPRLWYESTHTNLAQAIPDNNTNGTTVSFVISATNMRVEHVAATVYITHPARGNLAITLTSPSGMKSRLAEKHSDLSADYPNWTFTSVRHWGEELQGAWTLNVADRTAGAIGTLQSVRLDFFGTDTEIPSNRPPVLSRLSDRSVAESNLLEFAVSAWDTVDGDTVTLWATNVPEWASFPAVTNDIVVTNLFSGTPTNPEMRTVYFFASDKDGTSTSAVNITVRQAGDSGCGFIISEYLEGTNATAKALEFFNGTASGIDLKSSNCVVQIYLNGSSTPGSPISLTGTVAAGATYVVAHSSAPTGLTARANQLASLSAIGGDDAVVVRFGGTNGPILDRVGQVGVDPGVEWGSGSYSTLNNTLRRNPSVTMGDTNAYSAFDPTLEWQGYGPDIFVGFGEHMMNCEGAESPPILNPIGNTATEVGSLLEFTVSAESTGGDVVSLSASNLPQGATFTSSNETGVFRFTPTPSQMGTHSVGFYASDNDGVDTETIEISVSAPQGGGSSNVLVYFDFDDGANFEPVPESVVQHLQVSAFESRDGKSTNAIGNPGRAIADSGWTGTVQYFEFTVNVETGYTMAADGMTFDDLRSSTGPLGWRVRYSGDGYGADLSLAGTHSSYTTNVPTLFMPAVTGQVTFRVYADNASMAGATWRLDNVKLRGAVYLTSEGNDSDEDGMSDDWETAQFGSLTNEAAGDWDEDGVDNLSEYIAGTEPTNNGSYLQFDDILTPGGFQVRFATVTGRTYWVEYAEDLLWPGAWSNLATGLLGSNDVRSVSDTNASGGRIYRVGVQRN
ncbi:MAG TPA: S8 family serine peptidase [Kiritimatiellia bacterium]|nr:S8 family serine peptidase [Kiritimatiellia bacterium]